MAFRIIDHTADLAIEVEAASLDQLFMEAARGFVDCVTSLSLVECGVEHTIRLTAATLESLLVDWLGELLFVFETRDLLFAEIAARVSKTADGWSIEASARGETFDTRRHPLKVPIKAVTYHRLQIEEDAGLWRSRVIFDI